MQETKKADDAKAAALTFEQASTASSAAQSALDAYVTCITGTANPARGGADFQKRLAQANGGKYGTLGVHIRSECTPAFRAAIDGLGARFVSTDKLVPAWTAFEKSARDLAGEADQYGDKVAAHAREDQLDQSMVDAARKWSLAATPEEEVSRFESFFACAVPDAKTRTDKEALSHWASAQCTMEAPGYAALMERLRLECAPKLTSGEPPLTAEEHAALAPLRAMKVVNNTMNLPQFVFAACTEHARRQWAGADGMPLVRAFGDAMGKRQMLDSAVAELKPQVPSPT